MKMRCHGDAGNHCFFFLSVYIIYNYLLSHLTIQPQTQYRKNNRQLFRMACLELLCSPRWGRETPSFPMNKPSGTENGKMTMPCMISIPDGNPVSAFEEKNGEDPEGFFGSHPELFGGVAE